ncbi:hypothetical protein FQY83_07420 [Luteimonas marina]|uniref:Uncharacterized protein n=1 Tax=Luteimonas marina TaxID=488485 RepID=A0A5C5U430_9GAMM|nr:hypothetical protein [Luteimonas marina]TWT21183.1 hypothetical protein FQY83_07420 [Luteimonas marina]
MADDVHLGKLPAADPASWQGRTLGEVVNAAQVERVILLRAVTSAPADLDLANVRRMLVEGADAQMEAPDPLRPLSPWRARDGIWHAVLLMRSGGVFELEIHAVGDRRRGCLAAGDGAFGCFDLPEREMPPADP